MRACSSVQVLLLVFTLHRTDLRSCRLSHRSVIFPGDRAPGRPDLVNGDHGTGSQRPSRTVNGRLGYAMQRSAPIAESARVVADRMVVAARPDLPVLVVLCRAKRSTAPWLWPRAGGSAYIPTVRVRHLPAAHTRRRARPAWARLILAGAAGPEIAVSAAATCAAASLSSDPWQFSAKRRDEIRTTAAAGRASCTSPTPSPAYRAIAANPARSDSMRPRFAGTNPGTRRRVRREGAALPSPGGSGSSRSPVTSPAS